MSSGAEALSHAAGAVAARAERFSGTYLFRVGSRRTSSGFRPMPLSASLTTWS